MRGCNHILDFRAGLSPPFPRGIKAPRPGRRLSFKYQVRKKLRTPRKGRPQTVYKASRSFAPAGAKKILCKFRRHVRRNLPLLDPRSVRSAWRGSANFFRWQRHSLCQRVKDAPEGTSSNSIQSLAGASVRGCETTRGSSGISIPLFDA